VTFHINGQKDASFTVTTPPIHDAIDNPHIIGTDRFGSYLTAFLYEFSVYTIAMIDFVVLSNCGTDRCDFCPLK
jgi:hypothetical protein